jgi:hypothetical protein
MGGNVAEFRLIVAPEIGFGEIEQAIQGMGLLPGPDSAATAPTITGEREFAYWTAPEDGSRVHYSFNPAVFLRVLTFSGRSAIRWHAAVSGVLTGLGPREITALLQSSSRRELLLGLYAAAELRAVGLIADVEALRVHTDRRVSQTAAQVVEKLVLALVSVGADQLLASQRRHPDRSAVFAHLGDAGTRRETLLWLIHDGHGSSPETVKVLRSGLVDPDWRVRVTAMFVAARLKLKVLWQEVRQMELPANSRCGLNANGRSLLRAARNAILSELAGEPLPDDDSARAQLMRELRDAVAGRDEIGSGEVSDWVSEWLSRGMDIGHQERAG